MSSTDTRKELWPQTNSLVIKNKWNRRMKYPKVKKTRATMDVSADLDEQLEQSFDNKFIPDEQITKVAVQVP